MSFTTILKNVPEEEVVQDETFNFLDMSWIIDTSQL